MVHTLTSMQSRSQLDPFVISPKSPCKLSISVEFNSRSIWPNCCGTVYRTVRLLSKPTTQDSQDFRVDVLNARTKQQLTTKRIEVRFAERSEESFLSASTARQEKSSRRASGPVEHPDVSGADSEAASSSKTPSGSGSTAYGSSQVKSAKKIQETEHVWFKRNWYLLLCMSICIAVLLAPLGNKCTASDDEDAETVDEATVENSESTFDTLFPPDLMDSKWWQILSRVLERSVATFVTALHVTCEFKCFAAFFLGAFVTKCLLEATPVGSNA